MKQIANVIGATGLVGEQLIKQLLDGSEFNEVRIFVRRKTGLSHPKLKEFLIDFDQPESWASLLQGDVLFSTLGTTLKTARSKENQYKVDFTYQYEFARIAAQNRIPKYVLVSSLGANSKSLVFYSRMKGELDDAVCLLPFQKIVIFRPSILDGNRKENRPAEKLSLHMMRSVSRYILKKYRPTPVPLLVERMIDFSLDKVSGVRIVEGLEIFS